jgi:hypothetical protein
MREKKQIAWDVIKVINGKHKVVDTVFYTPDCDATYVYKSLVEHDGYDPTIAVRRQFK